MYPTVAGQPAAPHMARGEPATSLSAETHGKAVSVVHVSTREILLAGPSAGRTKLDPIHGIIGAEHAHRDPHAGGP